MNVTIKGVITLISEPTVLSNGAKTLNYVVDNGDQYNNIFAIQLYKKAEDLQHLDNFLKYNKVGDKVEVEFTIRTNEYNGKYYTSLNHWKSTTLGGQAQPKVESIVEEVDDDLPF